MFAFTAFRVGKANTSTNIFVGEEQPDILEDLLGIEPQDKTFNVLPDIADVILPQFDLPDIFYDVLPKVEAFKMPQMPNVVENLKDAANKIFGEITGPLVDGITGPITDKTPLDLSDTAIPNVQPFMTPCDWRLNKNSAQPSNQKAASEMP